MDRLPICKLRFMGIYANNSENLGAGICFNLMLQFIESIQLWLIGMFGQLMIYNKSNLHNEGNLIFQLH